jgi:hypothetical protein
VPVVPDEEPPLLLEELLDELLPPLDELLPDELPPLDELLLDELPPEEEPPDEDEPAVGVALASADCGPVPLLLSAATLK